MTAPTTTLLPDELAFLNSIRGDPDNDTVRLAYADFLDGQDTVSVKCKRCKGKKTEFVHAAGAGGLRIPCLGCGSKGFVPDTTNTDRAELLRVQVPLDRLREMGCHESETCNVTGSCSECGRDVEAEPLRQRERVILGAHPEWKPPCPMCEGRSHMGGMTDEKCEFCSNRGRVGEPERGMWKLEVPTLATVLEQQRDASDCSAEWRLTDYGRTLRDEFPHVVSVRVKDRVPYDFTEDTGSASHDGRRWFSWLPSRDSPGYSNSREVVPNFLVDDMIKHGAIKSRYDGAARYYTPEFAITALGNAVARAIFSEFMK